MFRYGGLPPKEEIKRIKDEELAHPITTVEPGDEKKMSLPPAQESPAWKNLYKFLIFLESNRNLNSKKLMVESGK